MSNSRWNEWVGGFQSRGKKLSFLRFLDANEGRRTKHLTNPFNIQRRELWRQFIRMLRRLYYLKYEPDALTEKWLPAWPTKYSSPNSVGIENVIAELIEPDCPEAIVLIGHCNREAKSGEPNFRDTATELAQYIADAETEEMPQRWRKNAAIQLLNEQPIIKFLNLWLNDSAFSKILWTHTEMNLPYCLPLSLNPDSPLIYEWHSGKLKEDLSLMLHQPLSKPFIHHSGVEFCTLEMLYYADVYAKQVLKISEEIEIDHHDWVEAVKLAPTYATMRDHGFLAESIVPYLCLEWADSGEHLNDYRGTISPVNFPPGTCKIWSKNDWTDFRDELGNIQSQMMALILPIHKGRKFSDKQYLVIKAIEKSKRKTKNIFADAASYSDYVPSSSAVDSHQTGNMTYPSLEALLWTELTNLLVAHEHEFAKNFRIKKKHNSTRAEIKFKV